MQVLLSPAKKQYPMELPKGLSLQTPYFQDEITQLVSHLKTIGVDEIKSLMSISTKLAEENVERYQDFKANQWTEDRAHPAIGLFDGDVYRALDVSQLNAKEIEWANQHLFIISGLYGLIRPLDLIQPYRLEMKTKLKIAQYKNLYEFWGQKLSQHLQGLADTDQGRPTVVNLASNEYFKAISGAHQQLPIITIDFKENKNGQYKTIGIFAKRARGLMARWLIKHSIDQPEDLKKFQESGYSWSPSLSSQNNWVFCRVSA